MLENVNNFLTEIIGRILKQSFQRIHTRFPPGQTVIISARLKAVIFINFRSYRKKYNACSICAMTATNPVKGRMPSM